MTQIKNEKKRYLSGLIAALGCSILWGFLPIYWQSLKPIDSQVIILYRVALMAVCCFFLSGITIGFKNTLKPFVSDKKLILQHFIAGLLITANWSLYIWAVNANYVIQTCMGYFLEPLIVCIFGVVLYKERVNRHKKVALVLAVAGLCVMVVGYGEFPAIALGLGFSFAIYAAIKKNVKTSPLQSLFYETIFLLPIALLFITKLELEGNGALTSGINTRFILLLFSGLLTALPLGLFAFAAPRLPLITLGLTEYLSPSISLVLGIFIFKEPFDAIQFSAFVFIWIGLVFFTFGEVVENRDNKSTLDAASDEGLKDSEVTPIE
ncbi:MAG: EamA family transporter RarD [Peptostreptococcaceae bacterium]|nr:EamA family transporter RarD [Peptostreptococcaceae bacterium]MDY5739013.1 EamA family transporter RarD [Anaerovoracaceae bacterium]